MGPTICRLDLPRSGTLYSLRALADRRLLRDAGRGRQDQRGRAATRVPSRRRRLEDDNFQAKAPWQPSGDRRSRARSRTFLLAFLLLFIGAIAFGVRVIATQPVDRHARTRHARAQVGLRTGRRIASVDGTPITNGKQLVDTIHGSLGKKLDIVYSAAAQAITYVDARITARRAGKQLGLHRLCAACRRTQRVGLGEAFGRRRRFGSDISCDQHGGQLGALVTHSTKHIGRRRRPDRHGCQAAARARSWAGGRT